MRHHVEDTVLLTNSSIINLSLLGPCYLQCKAAFDVGVNAPGPTDDAREELEEDQEDIFDESSDEEVDHGHEGSTLVQGEIGSSATFLLGARTRYGRAIRFNNRLLY